MAETTTRYNRPDAVPTAAEKLRQEYMGLEQIKKALARAKVGSPEYKKALTAKQAAEKRIEDLNKVDKAERSTIANEKAAKERAELQEKLQRAEDYGTPAEVTKAKTALEKFDGKNPFVDTSGKGADVKIADTDGDGIPDNIDPQPKVAAKKPDVDKKLDTDKKTGDTGSKTPEADKIKTAWVGYLDSTFKTLPKEYKGQIDKLLATAKTENWNEDTFTEALKQTKWWKETLPSLRSFFIETHDPRNAADRKSTRLNSSHSH